MELGQVQTSTLIPNEDKYLRYAMQISHVNGGSYGGTLGCITSIENGFRAQTELTLSIYCTEAPTRVHVYYANAAFSASSVNQYDGVLDDLSGTDDENGYRRYSVTFTTSFNTALGNACYLRFEWSGGAPRYMTGVQLEPGPVATPFEHRPIATELALCQRYFTPIGTGLTHRYNSPTACRVFPTNRGSTESRPLNAVVDIRPADSLSFAGMFTATGSSVVNDVTATYTSITIGTGRRFMLNGLSSNLAADDFYSTMTERFYFDREL